MRESDLHKTQSMRELISLLESQPSAATVGTDASRLLITHTTNKVGFERMVADGLDKIKVTPCPFMGKNLSYFFYGRPAYRPPDGPANKVHHHTPICFAFSSSTRLAVEEIYPFDTGAFKKEMYRDFVFDDASLEQFSIGHNIEKTKLLVDWFYENEEDYYGGYALRRANRGSPAYLESYDRLINRGPEEENLDERCSTIEVQVNAETSLNCNVEIIIGPSWLYEQYGDLIDLKGWNRDMYQLSKGGSSNGYVERIKELLYRYLWPENQGV